VKENSDTSWRTVQLSERYARNAAKQTILRRYAMCNVLSHRDLPVISQDGNPALQTSKVKLRLFTDSVMKPLGEVTLDVHHADKQQYKLKF